MSWVKIDDGFDEHPKLIGLSPLAVTLQIRSLCWSSRNLTDGFIPELALARLAGGLYDPSGNGRDFPRSPEAITEELSAAGLWERTARSTPVERNGNGWLIHDYLKYNPARSKVEQQRERARNQRVQAGIKSGLARRTARSTSVQRPLNPDPDPQPLIDQDQKQDRSPAPDHKGKPRKTTPEDCPDCQHVLQEFNRVRNGVRPFTGAGEGLKFIHGRHREHGLDVCVRVASRRIRECLARPETVKFATPETIFRPANFERALNDVPTAGADDVDAVVNELFKDSPWRKHDAGS